MDDAAARLAGDLADDLDRAFPRLVEAHQDRLYSIALRFLGNTADAEEVAQDTFVRAYRAIAGYDPARTRALELRPWLAAILVNLCRNRVRRPRPPAVPIDPHDPAAPDPATRDPRDSPHEVALRRDAARRWAALVAGLPERYRTPVVLRHVDGMSYDEMAAALGRPTGTLKAQVHRGLALLRDAAERQLDLEREEMTA
jgi:RNA polymerase sigma-70 factor (ECF subfamily)